MSYKESNYKVEPVNESEVEYKEDFAVGEGARYTGQMKLVIDEQSKEQVYIKHGKGV